MGVAPPELLEQAAKRTAIASAKAGAMFLKDLKLFISGILPYEMPKIKVWTAFGLNKIGPRLNKARFLW